MRLQNDAHAAAKPNAEKPKPDAIPEISDASFNGFLLDAETESKA